jgi:N-acetylglucosaminyl-diphospho-decaprenol L-rhamnosyltransferase
MSDPDEMDLSIIVVNWNVKELLRNCLKSLLSAMTKSPGLSTEIIVVDSASSDGSTDMVRTEFPQLTLVASSRNLGYAGGNNAGVAKANGRYLFLLNPDTVVQPDSLTQLVSFLDAHPDVGAVGPRLQWPDGSLQSSRRRFPTLGSLFWESTLLGQWFPENRHIRRYHLADHPPDRTQPVDWVVGAAVMIRRQTWNQIGPIDESFFMYFEETDWCKRAGLAGWQTFYLPTACVTHFEGKSSEQVVAARTLRFQRSKLRYTHKYFGPAWGRVLHIFLWGTFVVQWLEETAKWLVGHRRQLRRQRMNAYGQLLREL